MNIVTTFPTINLNTANVHTETAQTDNQKRELVQEPVKPQASPAESKLAGDSDKTKQPGQSVVENQEVLLSEEATNKKIEEDKENESKKEEEKNQQQEEQKEKQQDKKQEVEQVELKQIKELKARDTEVRNHEQAHAAVGGKYAGSPSYDYQRGPDGNNYAVGGEVPIDVAVIANDPQATIDKMQQVKAAALAPAEPSSADRSIAADATQKIAAAQADLATESIKQEDKESQKKELETEENALEDKPEEKDEKVDFLSQRDTAINERATRISEFYQAATSPFSGQKFVQQA
jgi:hypothetical protein